MQNHTYKPSCSCRSCAQTTLRLVRQVRQDLQPYRPAYTWAEKAVSLTGVRMLATRTEES